MGYWVDKFGRVESGGKRCVGVLLTIGFVNVMVFHLFAVMPLSEPCSVRPGAATTCLN